MTIGGGLVRRGVAGMARARCAAILVLLGLACPFMRTAEPRSHERPAQAGDVQVPSTAAQGRAHVSDAACLPCHQEQASTYLHTSHHGASQAASKESVLGSFREDGSNVLMIADPAKAGDDPGLYFEMKARDDILSQTAVAGWPSELRRRSERMDLVIGTGTRGQSYLYWHGDQLFELPVSYWSDGSRWINSPGYRNGTMNFNRAITPRCLECHASFVEAKSADPLGNRYDKDSLVTGITCERCHGPGGEHVTSHSGKEARPSLPASSEAILNPAKFSRDRQVDSCALCHNGIRAEEKAPAFSFVPGERLDKYLAPNLADKVDRPDVHGNQVGLLKRSQCYLSSPTMSCSTCHDVHAPEHEAAWYSSRCLTCHQVESCGLSKTQGKKIVGGCVGCHMPVEPTTAFSFDGPGKSVQPTMRSHWIRVVGSSATAGETHPLSGGLQASP